jgi:predicted nucleotidyltransferase
VLGSLARDEATDTSDVDLLVRMEDGRDLLDFVASPGSVSQECATS